MATGQPRIHFNDRAFAREAATDCPHAQTATGGQRVGDKIERPFLIGRRE